MSRLERKREKEGEKKREGERESEGYIEKIIFIQDAENVLNESL